MLGKQIVFTILGLFGALLAIAGINTLGLYARWWGNELSQYAFDDALGFTLTYIVVGGFLIWISIKQLRRTKKGRRKVTAKLTKSNGDGPEFIEFKSMKDLNFWYKTNEDWEGVINVTVVQR